MRLRLPSISPAYAAQIALELHNGTRDHDDNSDQEDQDEDRSNRAFHDPEWTAKARSILARKKQWTRRAAARESYTDERERLKRVRMRLVSTGIEKSTKKFNALHPVSHALQRAKRHIKNTKTLKPLHAWRADMVKLEHALLEAGDKLFIYAREKIGYVFVGITYDTSDSSESDEPSPRHNNRDVCGELLSYLESELENARRDHATLQKKSPKLRQVIDAIANLAYLIRTGEKLRTMEVDQIAGHIEESLEISKSLQGEYVAFVKHRKEMNIWRREAERRECEIAQTESRDGISRLPPGPSSGSLARRPTIARLPARIGMRY